MKLKDNSNINDLKGDDEEAKYCVSCCSKIHLKAKVCPHCNNYQSRIYRFLSDITPLSSFVIVLVSIGMLIVSIYQFKEARNETIKASEAVKEAQLASANALKSKELSFDSLRLLRNTIEHYSKGDQIGFGPPEEERRQLLENIDQLLNEEKTQ